MLYDGHGSTRQLIGTVDNSRTAEFSNLRISTYDFDAYGIELPQTATSQAKPQANSEETNLRYSGEFFDKDLNQQYLRARYYNQNNGQFNRLDPYSGNLSDPQSLHKYAYCHQDPVNHIDPSGNFSLVEVAAVSTIIGVLTGMHHYYNWTHKMSAWNSVIFAFFTTVTVALSIIFAPVIASAMSGIILSGGVLLEISALIMIPLAINYGGTLLEAVDIIFDSKKSVMERISAIGYLVAQLVTFWSASKASKGISKSATKSTGAPKSEFAKGLDGKVISTHDSAVTLKRPAVVLGEGMGSIKVTAKALQKQGVNAKWYQAWGKNFPKGRLMTASELAAAKTRNARWLRTKINKGYDIYDIGIDPFRRTRSPFYELEQEILKETGTSVIQLGR